MSQLSKSEILAERCRYMDDHYGQQTIRNLRDHLRIEHRRRLPTDVTLAELERTWIALHPSKGTS